MSGAKKGREGWSHFGEQVDEMDEPSQRLMWEVCRDEGESFEDWMAGLYRGTSARVARKKQLALEFDRDTEGL